MINVRVEESNLRIKESIPAGDSLMEGILSPYGVERQRSEFPFCRNAHTDDTDVTAICIYTYKTTLYGKPEIERERRFDQFWPLAKSRVCDDELPHGLCYFYPRGRGFVSVKRVCTQWKYIVESIISIKPLDYLFPVDWEKAAIWKINSWRR